jgi:hypothetical protein
MHTLLFFFWLRPIIPPPPPPPPPPPTYKEKKQISFTYVCQKWLVLFESNPGCSYDLYPLAYLLNWN